MMIGLCSCCFVRLGDERYEQNDVIRDSQEDGAARSASVNRSSSGAYSLVLVVCLSLRISLSPYSILRSLKCRIC